MNPIYLATFLSLALFAYAYDDGQWRGEGLAESQDWGQWNNGIVGVPLALSVVPGVINGAWGNGIWAHGAAPLGPDGRVVDTPEVAIAKAAHLNAKTAALINTGSVLPTVYAARAPVVVGSWVHGSAPLGPDGRVVDTPEVAIAKAAHLAAKVNAVHGVNAW